MARQSRYSLAALVMVVMAASAGAQDSAKLKAGFLIKISLTDLRLTLMEIREEDKWIERMSFEIGGPKGPYLPVPLNGKVTAVDFAPYWYPTEGIRKDFLERKGEELPAAIPPGHPLNAMGAVKIKVVFDKKEGRPIRIHGTNDQSSVGKRVSRGCIRLRNTDALALAKTVFGQSTRVLIE